MTNGEFPQKLNCAAEICCNHRSDDARVSILEDDLGLSHNEAVRVSERMKGLGVWFAPAALARAIADLADHPGRTS